MGVPIDFPEWFSRMRIGRPGMTEFSVIIEMDQDGVLVASVPALHGCHTQAKSLDTLMKRIQEAVDLCLEVGQPFSNRPIAT